MIVLQYLAAGVCGLCATIAALTFALSFVSWALCEPAARRGPYRPRPGLALAAFTILSAITYTLLP
ncbi:MAG TPA: hypothetical protein PLK87_17975 [Verrucomicrobiota bacterium]|nr:hypothetical protein [Verrucomicrobiota bacterium]